MKCQRPVTLIAATVILNSLGNLAILLYGLNSGIIDRAQFSILITAVILSAIMPRIVAQRFFSPPVRKLTSKEEPDVEDDEFAPSHGSTPMRS